MSTENSQSPRPSYDDKRRNDRDCELSGRQNNLGNASRTPVASPSSKESEKEPAILSMRDVKGKRKADEIDNVMIVEPNLVQLPVATENNNEPEARTLDTSSIRNVRVPRNRTLLDSVKAHLAISGESARQDPVPSLLTRLSDPHMLPANSMKSRHMDDSQQNADENDHLRHSRVHPSSSCFQDIKANSKNSDVSVPDAINWPPTSMSAARPIVRQNSVATSTTVEDNNTIAKPSYQRILSRSLPVPNNSQNQVDNDLPNQVHDQQITHVQQLSTTAVVGLNFPDQIRPLAHSTTLNSEEKRTRLQARLEIEKQQVVQPELSATDNNYSPQPLDDIASRARRKSHPIACDPPLKPHERGPGVLDLASDSLLSEESRKRESKLRVQAQLRVRLAAEKRLSG